MASWVPLVFGIIGLIAGLVGFVTTLRNIRKHKKYNIPKGEWHYVGKLQDVNIKTTPGLVLTKFEWVDIVQQCNDTNYQKFMLLNSNGKLMFAADYPQMLHINATMLNDRTIQFTAPNMPPLVINIQSDFIEPLGLKTKKYKTVRKPLVRLHLLEGDAEQHKWFSQFILNKEKGVRLYLNIKPSIFKNWWLYGNSDFFPLIVLHTKSLEDFNSRLTKGHHVTAAELNGNLLIDTSTATNIKPFDEDRWHWLRIGEDDKESAYLKFKSYCYHASGPNVNGGTAENEKTAELLSTLKSYRLLDKPDDPVMGSYYTVRRPGPIKPNAKVYMQFSIKDRKQV